MAEQKVEQKIDFSTNDNFSVYDVVLIHGLKNRVELNDKLATIRAYSSTKGRYQVRLTFKEKQLNILLKPSSLTMIYPNKWTKSAKRHMNGIECLMCHSAILISNIISCPNCMAIYYCSKQCMKKHSTVITNSKQYYHSDSCDAYRQSIEKKYEMFQQRLSHFKFDVFDDKMLSDDRNWMQTNLYKSYISHRDEIDQTLMSQMMKNPKLLTSWKEWYEFRQISNGLPVAMKYYNPMTIYWMVQRHELLTKKTQSYFIIHLVGVDSQETNSLYEWSELILLYPGRSFFFICFGPDIPQKYVKNKKFILADCMMEFYFHPYLYNESNVNKYVDPRFQKANFVVGLNAGLGLGEYDGLWESAIKYIIKKQTIAYFTEYALYRVLLSCIPFIKKCGASVRYFEHNPFLAPQIMLGANKYHRCFHAINNVIYGVNI